MLKYIYIYIEYTTETLETQNKKHRGRPRFPERQGLEGLTPVEYRRLYQKNYYTLKPRKPKRSEEHAQQERPPVEPKEPRKRGRPRQELTEEERKAKERDYRAVSYQRHREKVIEKVKRNQAKKREETAETIHKLKDLLVVYELLTVLRHHKESAAGHPADEV